LSTNHGTMPIKPRRTPPRGAFYAADIGTANAAFIGIFSAGQHRVED